MKYLAKNIYYERKVKRNMSQRDLANALGIGNSSLVFKWENGTEPSAYTLLDIANFFGRTAEQMGRVDLEKLDNETPPPQYKRTQDPGEAQSEAKTEIGETRERLAAMMQELDRIEAKIKAPVLLHTETLENVSSHERNTNLFKLAA